MKFLLTTFMLLTSYIATFAQKETPNLPVDSTTNKITYSEVVTVDSSNNKQELYSRAREWFAKVYNSAQNVIQMDDKESGKIVGKALMTVYFKWLGASREGGYINYTLSVQLKNGRYKYEITDFYHTGGVDYPDYGSCESMMKSKHQKKVFNGFLIQLDNNIKALVLNLKESMAIQTTAGKKDNW